jgi:hypothetical protein
LKNETEETEMIPKQSITKKEFDPATGYRVDYYWVTTFEWPCKEPEFHSFRVVSEAIKSKEEAFALRQRCWEAGHVAAVVQGSCTFKLVDEIVKGGTDYRVVKDDQGF